MLELIDKGRCTDAHPAPLLFFHGGSLSAWCWDEHFLDFSLTGDSVPSRSACAAMAPVPCLSL
jgi:hypothetical protein